ncbi:MAG: hypothetical protein AABX71_00730 [Nanoarchaeota archaeon]
MKNQIWTGSYTYLVRGRLDESRISYIEGRIALDGNDALEPDVKPIDLKKLTDTREVRFP